MSEQVITRVAVIGAGYMGGGIAQVIAMAEIPVVIFDADVESTRRQHARLLAEAEDFERRGLFAPGSVDRIQTYLSTADSLEAAVADADLVEEAVFERPDVKGPVLARIEAAARPGAIIGSNTSTLPIGELASFLTDASRFLGVHFSNPAPFIPGVELIAHTGTDEGCLAPVEALIGAVGKQSARVVDKAGFVLNRLQYVLLKEAISLVEEGIATPEDIDTVVRTTFGFRLPFFGPFAIADMAGLDIYRDCFTTFEKHYGSRLASPEMLTDLVESGHLGLKQGGGFIVQAGDPSALVAYRNTAYARLSQLLDELGPAPL